MDLDMAATPPLRLNSFRNVDGTGLRARSLVQTGRFRSLSSRSELNPVLLPAAPRSDARVEESKPTEELISRTDSKPVLRFAAS
jgi:hypothetical protein